MKRLRKMLDNYEPLFVKGGRLESFHAIYEMVDTLFYSPSDVTRGSPHVRDSIDLKRVMIMVVFAATPCALFGMWNTGFQANTAMLAMGMETMPGWREVVLSLLGAGHDPGSLYDNFMFGFSYFLPIYIVTMAAGGFWEMLFSGVRNHEINEGFFVTSMLYVLILPATIPLWQVAIGISFGVVIGKEVFGGTGKNVLNPALVGRAFLYFAYPAQISGDAVWTAVDGFSGATALGISAIEGISGVVASGLTWGQAFLGQMQGSLGETSTAACLLGAAILIYSGIASWRIIVATFAGLIIPVVLTGFVDSGNPMINMPWYWHIALGGFAFGAVFMATDPVSACQTNTGRWVYGLLIGFMTWLIRVINPAFPEGIMLAILFANVFAPMIDYFVVRANVKRRVQRSV
ncbi:MAG: NADH:ubiquinone reductase (Na(+)-transporting) subunit B [Gammaproteobacteria bacterium]|nr:NADH:ubiquinone reductase (Na(+)-transporting) subunit B [Gammaproteobacteria bacterium]MDH3372073.1 NADH:ubiquinone reductase (Na(+)-transporting) subunit B [Gammaproteobacteria bacterium]MDH3407870.1 NADH:ubiquinone reductase (Na(+)-transporting) subunit B [Gammaproteobacteria bacterium]MDH3551528.1 NADH:ubiquinone reductase (Na(+)-transporting) subunit B [Gammaproteobacteria bacterium]